MELRHVPSVVRRAIPAPNTKITAAEQHTASTDTELSVQRADCDGVVVRNSLFVVSVRGCDGLREVEFKCGVFEPVEVRFVCVVCRVSG